jgi:DNA gyrase/topoisomerase IV subunit A
VKFTEENLDKFAINRIRVYGLYTLQHRVIPDFRDGLKPVHRRLIWSAHKLGITDTGSFSKCARLTGHTMGTLHPHGDSYDALVNMVNLSVSPFKGMGNFGSFNERPAASRYTEVKFSKYGVQTFLEKKYLEVGEYSPTYDGSDKEPVFLPVSYPNLLLNGSEGIAVGTTVNIPPFHHKGVTKLIKLAIAGEEITAKHCTKNLQLNYPYGNNIEDLDKLSLFFSTGESTIRINPTYEVVDETIINIIDVPPYFDSSITERLQKLDFVMSCGDYTDKKKFHYEVRLRASLSDDALDKAIKKVIQVISASITLRSRFTKRISDEEVDIFSIPYYQYFNLWAKWRINLEVKAQTNIREKYLQDIRSIDLLMLACKNLDKIFPILKSSKTPKEDLSKALNITDEDAASLLRFTLNSLSRLSYDDLVLKHKKVKDLIKETDLTIKNPNSTIIKEIDSIAL